MRARLFLSELGLVLLQEDQELIQAAPFSSDTDVKEYIRLRDGRSSEVLVSLLQGALAKGVTLVEAADPSLRDAIEANGLTAGPLEEASYREFVEHKLAVLVRAKLAPSEKDARENLRKFAREYSKVALRESAAKPDLQLIHSVQAMDEVDKMVNLLISRLREWYGLHFPELVQLVEDPNTFSSLVLRLGMRNNFGEQSLSAFSIPTRRVELILKAASDSKGGDIGQEDMNRIISLAQEVLHLTALRERLNRHVERTMAEMAANMLAVAGATIGARLIARAGGLERVARLPASTIQVLGAEKALFRALRTGGKPPKHGILFQHKEVHSAPRWQRGKIARSLAAKIAIAARIDAYGGGGKREEGLEESLSRKIEEIKVKYRDAPRISKYPNRNPRRDRGRGKTYAN